MGLAESGKAPSLPVFFGNNVIEQAAFHGALADSVADVATRPGRK
ncbi:hypothetical protein U3653_18310 [Nocardia sp. CDC186]|uniref:Uncharacterized protein n=1 Tax=Nocardia implantans TaxID=3108168 RepID=A0ABU6AXG5_9NOCA|nr:hypothetical protein [Nocardia sp. CDC186]MEA3529401.1 hypothetical protein [Nocardia sp. CDC192]MEB3511987.1 hypothetical protein [Nocardia sp. CDC186]